MFVNNSFVNSKLAPSSNMVVDNLLEFQPNLLYKSHSTWARLSENSRSSFIFIETKEECGVTTAFILELINIFFMNKLFNQSFWIEPRDEICYTSKVQGRGLEISFFSPKTGNITSIKSSTDAWLMTQLRI